MKAEKEPQEQGVEYKAQSEEDQKEAREGDEVG